MRRSCGTNLGTYKAEGRFLDGYPDDERTFFAPRDNVHGLLVALLGTAQHSIVVNMFGYDDDELNTIIQGKAGRRAGLRADEPGPEPGLGGARKGDPGQVEQRRVRQQHRDRHQLVHNAISHLKIVIVDGVYTVKGSTNWSLSGEQQQDNELSLSRNAVIAAETRAILDLNHDFMLKQMVGSGLNVAKFLAPATPRCLAPAAAPAGQRGRGGVSAPAVRRVSAAESLPVRRARDGGGWRRWCTSPPRPAG